MLPAHRRDEPRLYDFGFTVLACPRLSGDEPVWEREAEGKAKWSSPMRG